MGNYKFETLQLHVGQEQADPASDARAVPIYQTTSYVFHNSKHAADRFGLAELYQLRGRVGRPTRHAYAYFTYRPGKAISEIAEKRLGAIREYAEFGAGFKIALRDLEIRGAGNILGAEQHGHDQYRDGDFDEIAECFDHGSFSFLIIR